MTNRPEPPNKDDNNEENSNPFNNNTQRVWLLIGVFVLFLAFLLFTSQQTSSGEEITLNELATQVQEGVITEIVVKGDQYITATTADGEVYSATKSAEANLLTYLGYDSLLALEEDIQYDERPADNTANILFQIALFVLPVIIIVWFIWRMMRSVRGSQDQAMNFGRSRARVSRDMERPQVTFSDVAGAEEAKEEVNPIHRQQEN